jgi:hypothetical protein
MTGTPTAPRYRTALAAGGITLLAALAAAAVPAEAAVTRDELVTASDGTRFTADTGTGTGTGIIAGAIPGKEPGVEPGTGPGVGPGVGPGAAAERRGARRPAVATLEAVKARSASQIARRQTDLASQLTLVTSGSPALTSADRQALASLIRTHQAGLAALGTKIAADTDLATARSDHQRILTGHRIYALVLPQIRLVRANDALTGIALPRLTDAQSRLRSALAEAGKTDEAAAKMADLQAQIDTISSSTSGLSARLLAFTPAQWNADHTVLAPSRQSLQACRTALQQARTDIVAVRAMLGSATEPEPVG